MRWWASHALISIGMVSWLGACHGAAPAMAGSPERAAPEGSCKVSTAACDPEVTDDTALALVRRRCVGCHAEGGKAEHPLIEASALREERENVALRLAGCEMPPDETPLPADERARLIGWAACGPADAAK